MTRPFLTGQKANGLPLDKSLRSKKQKQHQRVRKEKPQQHNFTHRLLAAALKVHGYPCSAHIYKDSHPHRLLLFSVLCTRPTLLPLTKISGGCPILSPLIIPYQQLAVNPGNRLRLPKGSLFILPATLPLEPQWEHILHGL